MWMDDLDNFMVGQMLDGHWRVAEPRYVERDTTSPNRTYVAKHADGHTAFVKVLDAGG